MKTLLPEALGRTLLALTVLAGCAISTAPPGDDPPEGLILQFEGGAAPTNVLMISIDTLRRDFVGRYATADDAAGLTPALDQLLDEGVTLENHHSCANWTYSSVLCALSGQYNADMGYVPALGHIGEADLREIPSGTTLLPGLFQDRGYRTSLVSTNPFLSQDYNFDDYYDTIRYDVAWKASDVVDEGLTLLDGLETGGKPWFLHLHFIDPHSPYNPPEGYVAPEDDQPVGGYNLRSGDGCWDANEAYGRLDTSDQAQLKAYARALYAGEVAYTDDQIARLMDTLEARGSLDDTLVVLWSDHGEQLWDRDQLEHGERLHLEEVAAIATFWARDLAPLTLDVTTSHRDLAPTLTAAYDIEDERLLLGRPLEGTTEEAPIFSARVQGEETRQAVDDAGRRLLYQCDGTLEYYDLREDPAEDRNRLLENIEDARVLWEILEPQVENLAASYKDGEPTSPDTL